MSADEGTLIRVDAAGSRRRPRGLLGWFASSCEGCGSTVASCPASSPNRGSASSCEGPHRPTPVRCSRPSPCPAARVGAACASTARTSPPPGRRPADAGSAMLRPGPGSSAARSPGRCATADPTSRRSRALRPWPRSVSRTGWPLSRRASGPPFVVVGSRSPGTSGPGCTWRAPCSANRRCSCWSTSTTTWARRGRALLRGLLEDYPGVVVVASDRPQEILAQWRDWTVPTPAATSRPPRSAPRASSPLPAP